MAAKTDNRYKIEGSGTSTKEADASLEKERSNLIKKLEGEKAPTTLNVVETEYIADFDIKESEEDNYSLQRFGVKTKKGWMVLHQKANKTASDLGVYTPKYNVQEFIELTDKQREALNPTRKTKPAGYEPRTSSIDGFVERLR